MCTERCLQLFSGFCDSRKTFSVFACFTKLLQQQLFSVWHVSHCSVGDYCCFIDYLHNYRFSTPQQITRYNVIAFAISYSCNIQKICIFTCAYPQDFLLLSYFTVSPSFKGEQLRHNVARNRFYCCYYYYWFSCNLC